MIWEFIRDNWIIVTGAVGSLIAVILIPAFRGVALKALQAFILRLGKAIMSMLTAEALTRGAIWVLRKLAKKTKGTWDDELVEELSKALSKKD